MNPILKTESLRMKLCVATAFDKGLCEGHLKENKNRLIEDSERKHRKAVRIWGLSISPNFRAIQDQPVPFLYTIKANTLSA